MYPVIPLIWKWKGSARDEARGDSRPPPRFRIVYVGSGERWMARLAWFAIELDKSQKRVHTNKEQLMAKTSVRDGE